MRFVADAELFGNREPQLAAGFDGVQSGPARLRFGDAAARGGEHLLAQCGGCGHDIQLGPVIFRGALAQVYGRFAAAKYSSIDIARAGGRFPIPNGFDAYVRAAQSIIDRVVAVVVDALRMARLACDRLNLCGRQR